MAQDGDSARAAFDAVLRAARVAGREAASGARSRRVAGRRGSAGRRGGYSGSGPDPRDPQPLGREVQRLIDARDWRTRTTAASVIGRWDYLVGDDICAHCRPESLRGGELTLVAESTAWATQLRMIAPRIVARLAAELGNGVVTRIHIHGPAAPTWRSGPRTVRGRGPRDTYG